MLLDTMSHSDQALWAFFFRLVQAEGGAVVVPAASGAHRWTGSTGWRAGQGHGTAPSLLPAASGCQTGGIWSTEAGGWRR